MKLTIESTAELLDLDGVTVRRWRGTSEGGVPCHVFVARIVVAEGRHQEFETVLRELQAAPPAGEPLALPTYHAGERYVMERGAGAHGVPFGTVHRLLWDRSIGRVVILESPQQPGGVRLSPRGDIPFAVLEQLRRFVVERIYRETERLSTTTITPKGGGR